MFPQLARFTDVALLLFRILVGIAFMTSGWKHLQDPEARSKDIGMSKGLYRFPGVLSPCCPATKLLSFREAGGKGS